MFKILKIANKFCAFFTYIEYINIGDFIWKQKKSLKTLSKVIQYY